MKKTYFAPQLEVVSIADEQPLLAGSISIQNIEADVDGDGFYKDARQLDDFFAD